MTMRNDDANVREWNVSSEYNYSNRRLEWICFKIVYLSSRLPANFLNEKEKRRYLYSRNVSIVTFYNKINSTWSKISFFTSLFQVKKQVLRIPFQQSENNKLIIARNRSDLEDIAPFSLEMSPSSLRGEK